MEGSLNGKNIFQNMFANYQSGHNQMQQPPMYNPYAPNQYPQGMYYQPPPQNYGFPPQQPPQQPQQGNYFNNFLMNQLQQQNNNKNGKNNNGW